MPNTAGSGFFSWLRFGKKKPKKSGYRPPIGSSSASHRAPDQPTASVRLPQSSRDELERRERARIEREPVELPPPRPLPPPPAPVQSAPGRSEDGSKTVILRIPDKPQGEVAGVLLGVLGPLKNELYRVYAGTTRLGRRDTENAEKGGELGDQDMAISRQHGTLLQLEDGGFHIKPLKPISVNGERLEEDGEMLRDGDLVQMGQSTFRFRVLL
jgi:FHA domain-containing protein